ncbi:hypothetical protein EUTSA_v10009856mg [Eutrema salsugineum]|uniref:Defensin-like domain-containing protein n=1 Tax=Eutrema salsugineum TaxID=72664 RepID=V4MP46_EUTSA|nr:hypothetical protein EUTSA_v10009856mg [Eutrema salsugineum]
MGSSKMMIAFTLTVLIGVSSVHCQTSDHVSGTPGEALIQRLCLSFNPCTPKFGDKQCKAICVTKKYKQGSCVVLGPGSSKYCCCNN